MASVVAETTSVSPVCPVGEGKVSHQQLEENEPDEVHFGTFHMQFPGSMGMQRSPRPVGRKTLSPPVQGFRYWRSVVRECRYPRRSCLAR